MNKIKYHENVHAHVYLRHEHWSICIMPSPKLRSVPWGLFLQLRNLTRSSQCDRKTWKLAVKAVVIREPIDIEWRTENFGRLSSKAPLHSIALPCEKGIGSRIVGGWCVHYICGIFLWRRRVTELCSVGLFASIRVTDLSKLLFLGVANVASVFCRCRNMKYHLMQFKI